MCATVPITSTPYRIPYNDDLCSIRACFNGRQPRAGTCASLSAFAVWLVESGPKQHLADSIFKSFPATISISNYVKRLRDFMRCSDSCFVMAGVYLDRYFHTTSGRGVSYSTIHRLLLISVVVAAKYIDDVFYPNSHYAAVGCVSLRNLNMMERQFLDDLNYKTHVNEAEFLSQTRHQMQLLTHREFIARAQIIPVELQQEAYILSQQQIFDNAASDCSSAAAAVVASNEANSTEKRSSLSLAYRQSSSVSTATSTPV